VVTKCDLATSGGVDIESRLAQINPGATVLRAEHGRIDPRSLLGVEAGDVAARATELDAWLAGAAHGHHEHGHDAEIASFVLIRDEPIRAVALTLFLEALAEHCGENLLRLKGIVDIVESPRRPAVMHGVQHIFHPPAWLPRWPSEDRRSRIVFIGRGLSAAWVHALLEAIEDEVQAASR
jgi:G3E family GTPase